MIKKKSTKILILVLAIIVLACLLLALTHWTATIEKRQKTQELEKNMQSILDSSGEAGLLKLAGVEVNDIYYSENGVTIFYGDNSSWFFSAEELQNMSVYSKCNKGVVNISSTMESDIINTGSGIVIDDLGLIVTNLHVVEDATSITVTLYDKTEFSVVLVGTDNENDLAVIQAIDTGAYEFNPLTFANSDNLKVGQKVLAIGNPFGYSGTMIGGMISGINRPIRNINGKVIMGTIQTDAPFNPGNSGGPLLNTQGKVIGINTTTYSTTGERQGLGLAIPSNLVLKIIPDLISFGKVERGWLDIVGVQLSESLVDFASLSVDKGILISQVVPSGEAQSAGLKGGEEQVKYGNNVIYLGGDVITKINGFDITSFDDLFLALTDTKVGDKVSVVYNRGGVEKEVNIKLIKRTEKNLNWLVR